MPPKKEPPKHTEVNRAARALNEEYNTLPFEAVRRSVLRHWPDDKKYRAEVHAKAHQPCVLGIQLVGSQALYTNHVQRHFYPVKSSSFPYLGAAFRNVSSGDAQQRTWLDVLQKLNNSRTPQVFWMSLHCCIGVTPSVERYEALYKRLVLDEGVKDVVGFVHACDGTLPFGDYIALRHAGASMEEAAALIDFEALRAEAADVESRMQEEPDLMDKYLIENDNEAKELQEEEERRLTNKESAAAGATTDASSHQEPTPASSAATPARPLVRAPAVNVSAETAAAQARRYYRRTNLFGNDPATSISWRENKASMHRRLAEQGLNHIRSIEARSASDAVARLAEAGITFPVVVKPVSGAGSEFVTLCHNTDDVHTAFSLCKNVLTTQQTLAAHMVVEDFIDGAEYVVNIVSFEGKHVVTDVWKSWKYPKETVSTRLRSDVETKLKERAKNDASVQAPAPVSTVSLLYDRLEFVHGLAELDPSSEPRQVVDYTLSCVTALGMVNGCSHCEVRVDERRGSPTYGQPVLIELNPRMQGDPPRATQLVGYDQYTLLYYLSAVAAAYDTPSETPFPAAVPHPLRPLEKCSLPWPPVPTLYRSRQPRLRPGEEPVTRHVVFLTVPESGVVCSFGVHKVMALPTFLRVTRSNLFVAPQPGFVTAVVKTVDLYSSPGACVMEGTASQIRKDTQRIHELEAARLPETAVTLLKAALEKHREQLEIGERYRSLREQLLTCLEAQSSVKAQLRKLKASALSTGDGAAHDPSAEAETTGSETGSTGDSETASGGAVGDNALSGQALIATLLAEKEKLSSRIAHFEREIDECQAKSPEARRCFNELVQRAIEEIKADPTPPLFVAQSEFELLRDTGAGSVLGLDEVAGTDEQEEAVLVLVKHPRLKELCAAEEAPAKPSSSPYSFLDDSLQRVRRIFA